MEVSSGVHQAVPNARLPSRFSTEAHAGNTEQQTSSLQTLAAAADSGELYTREVTASVTISCSACQTCAASDVVI